jgi:hypothetical protein
VKEIKFTQTTVAPSTDAKEVNLKDYVTVLDDLGRDVTKEHTVTFETANEAVVKVDGKVPNTATGSVIVVAVVKDGDKVVKSAKTTIKVSAAAPAEYVGSYVYTVNAATNTEEFNKLKDEEKVSYIFEGDKAQQAKKLAVYYKDQYGKSVAAVTAFNSATGAKLENLTPTVAIVENDGTIKPISKGTAYVKVTLGEIVQTIAIEVKEDAAITTMEVAPEAVSVVAGQDATSKVTFKDQYGKEQKADAKAVTVEPKDKEVATATFDATTGDVTVKGVKEGSTTVTVTYKSGELELTKDIAVKVEKAGDLQEYKAVVKDTTLDAGNTGKDADEKKAPNSTTIAVNKIDTNGNKIGTATPTLKVVDKDGKDVVADKALVTVTDATVTANKDGKEGTAYVQVSVGSLVIDTVEIKVVNTAPTPTTAEFDRLDLLFTAEYDANANTIKFPSLVENGTSAAADQLDLGEQIATIITVKNQFGKEFTAQTVTVEYTLTNAKGATVNNGDTKKLASIDDAKATVDAVVTSIKVDDKEISNTPTVVKLSFDQTAAIVEEGKALVTGYTTTLAGTHTSVNVQFANDAGKKIFELVDGGTGKKVQGDNQIGKFKVITKFADVATPIENVFVKSVNDDNDGNKFSEIKGSISSPFKWDAEGKLSAEKYAAAWNSWKPANGFGEIIKDKDVEKVTVEFEYKGQTIKKNLL